MWDVHISPPRERSVVHKAKARASLRPSLGKRGFLSRAGAVVGARGRLFISADLFSLSDACTSQFFLVDIRTSATRGSFLLASLHLASSLFWGEEARFCLFVCLSVFVVLLSFFFPPRGVSFARPSPDGSSQCKV